MINQNFTMFLLNITSLDYCEVIKNESISSPKFPFKVKTTALSKILAGLGITIANIGLYKYAMISRIRKNRGHYYIIEVRNRIEAVLLFKVVIQ